VLTKIEGAATGKPPIHRWPRSFKSLDDLQTCASSADGKRVVADAHAIRTATADDPDRDQDVVTFKAHGGDGLRQLRLRWSPARSQSVPRVRTTTCSSGRAFRVVIVRRARNTDTRPRDDPAAIRR
jgi:hypothetical protein